MSQLEAYVTVFDIAVIIFIIFFKNDIKQQLTYLKDRINKLEEKQDGNATKH